MAEICTIETEKIEIGTDLMKGNTNLIEWNSNLISLIKGTNMFEGCSNLTSFNGNLSNLLEADYMFYNSGTIKDELTNIGGLNFSSSSLYNLEKCEKMFASNKENIYIWEYPDLILTFDDAFSDEIITKIYSAENMFDGRTIRDINTLEIIYKIMRYNALSTATNFGTIFSAASYAFSNAVIPEGGKIDEEINPNDMYINTTVSITNENNITNTLNILRPNPSYSGGN